MEEAFYDNQFSKNTTSHRKTIIFGHISPTKIERNACNRYIQRQISLKSCEKQLQLVFGELCIKTLY